MTAPTPWRLACLAGLMLGGCAPAPTGSSTDEGSGGTEPSTHGSDSSGDIELLAPLIYDASAEITEGSMLYVVIDLPINAVTVRLGQTELEIERILMTDQPTGLFHVPPELELGEATLRVELREAPDIADTRPVEIRAPWMHDIASEVGLSLQHDASGSPSECAESHTGLAWGDYDGDGVLDAFFGNVGSGATLHRGVPSDAGVRFEETTQSAGLAGVDAVAMGTFVDLEGDGDLDLYVGRRGENRLFRNLLSESGQATFEEVGDTLGLVVDSQRTMGVAFGDYDGDGDLDLYEVNHAFCFPQADSEVRARDHLFENVEGSFVERTAWLGAPVVESVGFSAAWLDTDRDGDPDLVVINDDVGGDIGQPNAHWRNDGPAEDGSWRFTEVGAQTGLALTGVNGMGLAYGDLNDDGFVDLAFTNIGANRLLLSRGDGSWRDASADAGIERKDQPWGRQSITWAPHLLDADNDGDLDFYVTGGRIKGQMPVFDALFENLGSQRFEERTWSSGMADPAHAKASALVDFDGDGGLDVVTTAWGGALRVYRNVLAPYSGNHWLRVVLAQDGANADALGAIVTVEAGGRTRTCFHSQRPSLGGGSELACHFGLGQTTEIDSLTIEWPDGVATEVSVDAIDRTLRATR